MVTITGDHTGEVLMLSGIGANCSCLAKEVDYGEKGAEVGGTKGVCFALAGLAGLAGSGFAKACIRALIGGLVL